MGVDGLHDVFVAHGAGAEEVLDDVAAEGLVEVLRHVDKVRGDDHHVAVHVLARNWQ